MIFNIKYTFLCVFLICLSFISNAQSQYAKKLVDTLSAPTFWGRGYAKNGMDKAARFISNEMKQIGLQPLSESYLQNFNVATNIFEKKLSLKIDGKKLKPGKDYIIKANSPSLKGKFKLIQNEADNFSDVNNQLIIKKTNKLVWSPSGTLDSTVFIYLKDTTQNQLGKAVINISQEFNPSFTANNVCGYVPGTLHPDSFLVLTAHFDHLGGLGKDVYFPGANDNASGTALLLDIAKYYAKHPQKYSLVFIAFAAEEIGLKGSNYFVQNPLINLNKIKFLLNLDLMGNGEDGITIVNAAAHKDQYNQLVEWNNTKGRFKEIKFRENAPNSDHYPFTQVNVPAFFIYTLGGNQAYHDIYDIPATLPLNYFSDLEAMIKDFFQSF
ncbi:MAG TPA: M28 family peptidase [Edaphocola sp.]|nr:M28 family peptidase [Edaphocola sp.]